MQLSKLLYFTLKYLLLHYQCHYSRQATKMSMVIVSGLISCSRSHRCFIRIPKLTLLVFRVRCGSLNCSQYQEREGIMEFPLIPFNVLIQGLSGFVHD